MGWFSAPYGSTVGTDCTRNTRSTAYVAAPAVRKRAWDLGVELRFVPGTGPGGRITQADLEAYAAHRRADVQPFNERTGEPQEEAGKGASQHALADHPSCP